MPVKIHHSQHVGHLYPLVIAPSVEAFFAKKDKYTIAVPLADLLDTVNDHETDDMEGHYPDGYPFSLPIPIEASPTP